MTVTALLRAAAVTTALLGVIDPSWTDRRAAPVAVEIVADADTASAAADVRRRLAQNLGDHVLFESDAEPAALVVVGGHSAAAAVRDGVPISTVSLAPPPAPNVQVVAADDPSPVRVGWAATFTAIFEARGLAGKTSTIVLEQRGAEVARLEHRWTRDPERLPATLRYTPPGPGTSTIRLRAVPVDGETSTVDNAADLRLVASEQPFKILVHEPRPSWNTTFVRRAIEHDPSFEVSTLVRASKGLEVRAGTPPAALTADSLEPFDAVLVGAPEELGASEVDALRLFARVRGGAVFLLPDRRPSGRYLELVAPMQVDEVLVENAVELRTVPGAALRASELAVLRTGAADIPGDVSDVLASIPREGGDRAVVTEWLAGIGRIVFSGAMDAWRYRASRDDGFGRFWRVMIAEAALSAPGPVVLSVSPGVPRPGESVRIRARIRPTEFEEAAGRTHLPWVRARLVGGADVDEVIRLWPTTEPGVFEGRFQAPSAGTYDLQATTGRGATTDEVVTVVADARRPSRVAETDSALDLIAASTGGVAVGTGDLVPLERHLRGLASGEVEHTVRPARSAVLLLAFASLLGAEWTVRRRQGRP